MRTIRTVEHLRAHLRAARDRGGTVGLVPTMGALHDGHLSLIAAAGRTCSEVVVSVFVNPRQFDDAGDLAAYPRDEAADAAAAERAGATILFAPGVEEIYPDGFATEVRITSPLTSRLEGAHRGAGHFHGVTTVVAKLLNMVGPDVAFFGAKDAQQVLVVRRLVRDLNLPVRLAVGTTVREADGLARSSRNVRLSAADRERAVAVPRALTAAVSRLAAGERDAEVLRAAVRAELAAAGLDPEYVAIAEPDALGEVDRVEAPAVLAVAVPVGAVRLIDNVLLDPVAAMLGGGEALPSTGALISPLPVAERARPAHHLQEA